ncbi:DUF3667 domain-containing protein [Marivirga sp. S37H4]|uniref:DUF3667 domain-containing protein n=1 Tax=Marivirga aurantiaca TaxID=2802615 RepID=A0A934WV83_9BACT|nr:DUF3667 domain-containing protein [Marivirga aurantiaca]MBK6263597.1 DUF3667 domain-containing protein [Marivirga aurantiaca]
MKSTRKQESCLNCGQALPNAENYCPECGQKNLDQRVSILVFIQDFFSNYLSFDTTLFRTMKPFLLNPGKLTLEFNKGRRNYYIHPIRLYLIFSLFYFFIVSANVPANATDTLMNKIYSSSDNKASLAAMDSTDRREIEEAIGKNGLIGIINDKEDSVSVPSDSSRRRMKWPQLKAYAIDDEITDSAFSKILDREFFNSNLEVEQQRAFIANSNLYLINSLRNLPIMMFILLPLFGLFLMLLHLKSKKFYVEHLIHAIHLHAFAYFLYGIGIVLIFNINMGEMQGWIFFICFVAVSLYAFLSVKKMYKNGLVKAFVKFCVLGLFYFLLLMSAVALELYVSLLML